jgi:hypothetical protein
MILYLWGLLARFLGAKKRWRQAYARGYEGMQARLNASYCGPDLGYDNVLVSTESSKVLNNFRGSKNERRSFEEGVRDAITVYEREHGAP